MGAKEAFLHDTIDDTQVVDLGREDTGNKSQLLLFNNLSKDITITSFQWAQNIFENQDLATLNEKRELLKELWLYVDDGDESDSFKKEAHNILVPVIQRLSDGDIEDVFPKIYDLLFHESM